MPSGFLLRLVLACIVCALPGCGRSKGVGPTGPSNRMPVVRFTDAPVSATDRASWSVTLRWSGYDPDGRVVAYRYATDAADPYTPDAAWMTTDRSEARVFLSASRQDSIDASQYDGQEFHTVSLVAVDDRGLMSPTVSRSFFATTIAPTVQITVPSLTAPVATGPRSLPPHAEVEFVGEDPDGAESRLPASYRWILLSDTTDVSILAALASPDSIRSYYAPRHWAGWDSLPGSATRLQLPDLPYYSERLLVLVAIDAAGAYSPVMSWTTNLLRVRVSPADNNGPRLTVFNEDFSYEYPAGRYRPGEPADIIHYDAAPGVPTTIRWFAVAAQGATVRSYVVHFGDLNDAGVVISADSLDRSDPGRAQPNGPIAAVDLGPLAGGTRQTIYIEAFDSYGGRSLATLDLRVVVATLESPLLIVDDTRLAVDQALPGGGLRPPVGLWPTQAELDTFLFARGGLPWRAYPPGVLSKAGLFFGYPFDTLGTRTDRRSGGALLATLLRYRRVIWISDRNAALSFRSPEDPVAPMGALRYMSGRGQVSVLAQYVRAGGSVWLVGGGAAASTNIEYDRTSNNGRYGLTFSNSSSELIPGRFMFDLARWQSEFRSVAGVVQIRKRTSRHPSDHPVYSDPRLPATLLPHSLAAGDSFPPNRAVINSDYYTSLFNLEYLSFSNNYLEDVDHGPRQDYRAALDTVYAAAGSTLPPPAENLVNACMTVYPTLDFAPEPQVIVSGFDLWSFQRVQCQAMADFVLQRLWNLAPGPRAPGTQPAMRVAAGGARGPIPSRAGGDGPSRRPVRAGRP